MNSRNRPAARPPQNSPSPGHGRGTRLAYAGLLVAVVVAAYSNSIRVPYLFDDEDAILENSQIRHLWPPWQLLQPPRETTVAGRPLVNLSLAVCYAVGGYQVAAYHVFNILVHAVAGLLIFGIVRRMLRSPALRSAFAGSEDPVAAAIALIWAAHPLNTMCVTYIIQRAESLMGLCYLLTLYAVIRSQESAHPRRWWVVAVLACFAGMGAKESMATAPVVVLIYDAIFLAGSFRDALRIRRMLYAGLAACWIPLAILVAGSPRPESAGLAVRDFTPLQYLLTQPEVLLHYVRLVFWPHPLILDYEWPIAHGLGAIALPGIVVLGVLLLTAAGAIRRRPWAMPGVWFFGVLAVSSSIVPIVIVASEHRMYLPSVAVIGLVVTAAWQLTRRAFGRAGAVNTVLVASAVVALAATTVMRNRDYASALVMWRDVVDRRPQNARAAVNLGAAMETQGDLNEALRMIQRAVALKPDYGDARYNLGTILAKLGRIDEAMDQFRECLRLSPREERAEYNLGYAYQLKGNLDEAIAHYRRSLELKPSSVHTRSGLGIALALKGQSEEAVRHLREVVREEPDRVVALNTLAWLLATQPDAKLRDGPEAVRLAERANRLTGGANSGALDTLAAAYAEAGRFPEAVATGQRAVEAARNEKQGQLEIAKRLNLYKEARPYRDASARGGG